MHRRHVLAVAAVAGASGAGCLGSITDGPGDGTPTVDVEYSVSNETEEPYRVRLFVLEEPPTALQITREDGSTDAVDLVDGGPPQGTFEDAVAVEPAGEHVDSRSFRLEPGSGVGGSFEDVPSGPTVASAVEFVDRRTPLRSYGVFTCSEENEEMSVTLRVRADGGVDSGVACGRSVTI